MKFWDSSALVSLFIEEPATERVRAIDRTRLIWRVPESSVVVQNRLSQEGIDP